MSVKEKGPDPMKKQKNLSIIDVHTHLFSEGVRTRRESFCRRDEGFGNLYGDPRARLVSPQELLAAMDRNGVGRSVICGFPWGDPGLCREENDYLLHCATAHPDRLIPFACFPPRAFRAAEREVERCLSRGIAGFGEMAFYKGGGTSMDGKRLASLLAPLSKRGIPFLLHANEPVGHEYPGKSMKSLSFVYQLLLKIPEVKVILAHWGGGFFFYELMPEVAQAARNVYYDTAASPFLYRPRIYALAVDIVGPERVLFGSDYPLIPPARYFSEMEASGLSGAIQARIRGQNAEILFQAGAKGADPL